MAIGSLAYGKAQFFDDNGDPLAAGVLTFFQVGTSTPLAAYVDYVLTPGSSFTTLTLDSAGRATFFLGVSSGYKIVLKTSAGVTVWTVDGIFAPQYMALAAIASYVPSICQGRLTLTTGTPVTTADVTAAATVFWAPYKGNGIGLYDGASLWTLYTTAEVSVSIAGVAANLPRDVFARNVAGVVTLDTTAWTNTTTRATALTTQDGVLVKSGDTTRRYLGTICTTGTVGQTEDSFAKRFLWNYYHRQRRPMRVVEATATWNYTTATYRQANAAVANQMAFLIGVAEHEVEGEVVSTYSNTNAGIDGAVAIGQDVTNAVTAGTLQSDSSSTIGQFMMARASLKLFPAVGYHFWAWLEYSVATGTTTWRGTSTAYVVSGIHGVTEG